MKYKNLIGQIDSDINTNGERGITGETLNSVLNAMVSVLGDGYRIAGVVLADAVPPEQAENGMCYIAGEEGTYANFGNVTVRNDELALIYHNGTQWDKMSVPCRTFGYVEIHSDYTSLAWYEMNELRKDFAIIFDVRTNKKDVYFKCVHKIDQNDHDLIVFRTIPNIVVGISSNSFSFVMNVITVEYEQGLDGYAAILDDESYSKDIYDAQIVDWLLSRKQGVLSFDSAPTAGSTNPVTSNGINEALGGYYTKTQTDNLLSAKQNTLTFDNVPSLGSKNPVTSSGIKEAIDNISMPQGGNTGQVLAKASDLSFDTEWVDQSGGGGVTDVTVGGTSVVSGGVAVVPAIPDITDCIQKSQTAGLVKNDGTIDTTQYGTYSKPSGGIPSTDLSSAVQTSLGLADTAVQQVTVGTTTTGAAGTNASVTNSGTAKNPVLDFTIPRGADGQDAVNPFKGWWPDLATLKAAITAQPGDSAYVKDASPATTWSIYVYSSAATSDKYWADSGTDADTSNVQTFASGEELNQVAIDDSHLVNPVNTADSTQPVLADARDVSNSVSDLNNAVSNKLDKIQVQENGEFHIDEFGNIGYKYDEDGFDFAKISQHAINLLKNVISVSNSNLEIVDNEGFFVVDNNGYIGLKYDSNGLDSAIISDNFKNSLGLDITALRNLIKRQNIIGTEYNKKILLLGDSLTQGQGTGRVYGNYLAKLIPDYTIINKGEGGENIQDLMGRVNVYNIVTNNNITIPTNGQVILGNLYSSFDNRGLNILKQNPNVCNPVVFHGVVGNLSRSNNSYVFTRTNSGDNTINVPSNSPLFCYEGNELLSSEICILWIGQNGVWEDVDTYVRMIEDIVIALRTEHYVIIAPTNRSYGSFCNYEYNEMLIKMTKTFGGNYLDMLGYLCSDALSDASITPTSADEAAMANYMVPPSLLTDSVHFNATGYELIANKIYKHLITKKYI